ncbi:MAG: AAA family ATPase [Anaerolineales bacterium]|nr:AAA family ATPase [Anaerolineales bacterium]
MVIAIANQKGGVAKTTTTASLGGALTTYGKEVLLVDLDPQANLTLALGRDPGRVRGSITDVLFHSASLLSVSRETSVPGLGPGACQRRHGAGGAFFAGSQRLRDHPAAHHHR